MAACSAIICSVSLRTGGRKFADLIFEVVLIAVGVFLALWANSWHEDREHHAQARAALRNFVGEMQGNRQATEHNRAYHEALARELDRFLQSKEPTTGDRFNREVHFEGLRPVIFEHTAWDLALATQALSYLPPDLAFDISKVYTQQGAFQTLENSFLASAFTPATMATDDAKGSANAMRTYLGDVNVQEPAMLTRYDQVIPQIQRALARGPSH
jgi:hypothetical protein